jgi:type III restriction enzyme
MQRIIFETTAKIYRQMSAGWKSDDTTFGPIGQVFSLVEQYLASGKIHINPPLFARDELHFRIMYLLNMNRIVEHLWGFIQCQTTERLIPVFENKKVRSTADMQTWSTTKPCRITEKSHISHCVFDSTWEACEAFILEQNKNVIAFAKNDHLGFGIKYTFEGIVRTYYPDFLIRLDNGKTLVLETKGKDNAEVQAKSKALAEWVTAVNSMRVNSGAYDFGEWCADISFNVADVDGIIEKHLQ